MSGSTYATLRALAAGVEAERDVGALARGRAPSTWASPPTVVAAAVEGGGATDEDRNRVNAPQAHASATTPMPTIERKFFKSMLSACRNERTTGVSLAQYGLISCSVRDLKFVQPPHRLCPTPEVSISGLDLALLFQSLNLLTRIPSGRSAIPWPDSTCNCT